MNEEQYNQEPRNVVDEENGVSENEEANYTHAETDDTAHHSVLADDLADSGDDEDTEANAGDLAGNASGNEEADDQ